MLGHRSGRAGVPRDGRFDRASAPSERRRAKRRARAGRSRDRVEHSTGRRDSARRRGRRVSDRDGLRARGRRQLSPAACADLRGQAAPVLRPAHRPRRRRSRARRRDGSSGALARKLAAAFWPGPLTLVVPKRDVVPSIVTAGLPTAAVRVPAHPVARALLAAAGCPIAAPSANPFGYISPTLAAHVAAQIGDGVDLILDGGPCPFGVESTILDVSGDRPALLRPGAVEIERIEALIGPVSRSSAAFSEKPRAPGQLASHYAPHTAVVLLDRAAEAAPGVGRLRGCSRSESPMPRVASSYAAVEVLSETRDLREAAANLFARCLHRAYGCRETRRACSRNRCRCRSGSESPFLDRLRRAAGAVADQSADEPSLRQPARDHRRAASK